MYAFIALRWMIQTMTPPTIITLAVTAQSK